MLLLPLIPCLMAHTVFLLIVLIHTSLFYSMRNVTCYLLSKLEKKKSYNIKSCLDRVSNNHNNIKSLGVKVTVCLVQISESLWISWISSLAQQSFTAFNPSPSCALALFCRVWGAERLNGILYTIQHAGEHCWCFRASEQVAFAPGSSQSGIAFGYLLQYQLFKTHLIFLDVHPALELLKVCLLL